MSLRDRIRRIEEKLGAAVKADGEKLVPPILLSNYVSHFFDPDTGECRLKEIQFAEVEGKTHEREPSETLEHFEKRMVSLLPPLQPGQFAQQISFWCE